MEKGGTSRKRPFTETELTESEKDHSEKKVKFPKGKKAKLASERIFSATPGGNDANHDGQDSVSDPRLAAKKRADQRGCMTTQILTEEEDESDLSRAEVQYEENETFVENGIQIEPFNLDKEREEGYFDAAGNFVEFVNEKEEKDAWLDNLEVHPQLAEKFSISESKDEEEEVLTPDDIGQMKRSIADALEPGETILQALKRLKGNSNSRKEKMSTERKLVFDQLTEDAMKLMDDGDYDVYHETQDVFQREAEGYESLVQARKNGLTFSNVVANSCADATSGPSGLNVCATEIPLADAGTDEIDMFGDDDGNVAINTSSNESKVCSSSNGCGMGNQTSPSNSTQDPGFMDGQTDYVYDESSGYYYNSSSGYYYDPSSGLYCCASTGIWYSYNEENKAYEVVEQATENAS